MNYTPTKNMRHRLRLPRRQRGALTMISAVLVLLLLTGLIIYAVQVGVFEQRKSANDMLQKEAFHLAESALQVGKEYLLANARDISSPSWLADRWKSCEDENLAGAQGTHPCYGEPADNTTDFPANLRDNMYFYAPDEADLRGPNDPFGHATLPVDVSGIIPDATERVHVYALLCMMHVEQDVAARTVMPNSPVQGCTVDPNLQDPVYYMVTLLARGEADCAGGECNARALLTEKVGSFGPAIGEGGPAVPLTSRSTLPPGGTAELVPNPNAGGVGVPVSAWINQNENCGAPYPAPGDVPLDPNGASWSTCERQEWYGVDNEEVLDGYRCPITPCSCGPNEKRISYSDNTGQIFGIDLLPDPNFPCDLWQYIFGLPKYDENGEINQLSVDFVRNFLADEIVQASDCDSLGPNSVGIIWVEGGTCTIAANAEVGSPEDDPSTEEVEGPVLLISAGASLKLVSNASIFGTLFITDALVDGADLETGGGLTIYGAAVVDSTIDKFTGTFQVVYVEDIIKSSTEVGKFGSVGGGWSDFHQDWR